MTAEPLELTDRDGDALAMHIDDSGAWVTCTSGAQEITIGPLAPELLERWLAAARA